MKLKNLTIRQIAIAGLWTDDPYGDGIRLERIRNPVHSRLAAIRIRDGRPQFWDEKIVRAIYVPQIEKWTNKNGDLNAEILRNCKGLTD